MTSPPAFRGRNRNRAEDIFYLPLLSLKSNPSVRISETKVSSPLLSSRSYVLENTDRIVLVFMFSGHCNVPATYRHSPLGTWVGKQREEYKKLKDKKSSQLDNYRIDKLNDIGFQWSLMNWTTVSWDDRFEVSSFGRGRSVA